MWAAALVALVVVAYLPTFVAGFVWDDDDYVTKNEALRSLGGLVRLWLEPRVTPQYYPVTFTSLWIDYRLWGPWAPGFHLTNVLLHAVNAVLVWRLLDRLAVPGAWIAAALFAVHPVHVESVAWVTERKNVVSGVFYLAAALVFVTRVAGMPPGDTQRRRAYLAVVGLTVLALLSKSVTATLPVAIAIALWWRDGRVRRADLLALAPLLALGAAAGLLTAMMERHRVGAVGAYWDQTFAERCLIAGRALWFYAGKLLWPYPVIFNYERWSLDARDPLQWVWPIAALGVGAGAWLARARIGRGVVAALAFFAVTLAPALGFVNVYPMRYSFVADHFQYLASLGVLALVSAAMVGFVGPRVKHVVTPVVAVLALATTWQCFAYRDPESLWVDTLVKNPRSVLALQNMGTLAYGHGERYDHRPSFEIALSNYQRARDVEPEQPDIWNSIGVVQARLGRRDEAIAAFETALRFDPRHAEAARNLGSVLAAVGRRDEAIAAYERALAAAPAMIEAREDLAVLLARAGRFTEAEAQLREAIARGPSSPRVHAQLGATLGAQGRFGEAVAAYQEAVRLAPRSVDAYAGLAEAEAKGGDFDRAITAAERARELARSDGQASMVAEIERRIASYRDGRARAEP
jgi:tetratricopeptide (TPR) repeat protein